MPSKQQDAAALERIATALERIATALEQENALGHLLEKAAEISEDMQATGQPGGVMIQPLGQTEPKPVKDLTLEDVMQTLMKLGRDAAIDILRDFGVTKVVDLKPEQFADVLEVAYARQKG